MDNNEKKSGDIATKINNNSPFEPANLKLSQNFGASTGVKKHSPL